MGVQAGCPAGAAPAEADLSTTDGVDAVGGACPRTRRVSAWCGDGGGARVGAWLVQADVEARVVGAPDAGRGVLVPRPPTDYFR